MHLLFDSCREISRTHAISPANVLVVNKMLYKVLLCIHETNGVIGSRSPPPVINELIKVAFGNLARFLFKVAGQCLDKNSSGCIGAIFPHPQMYG